MRCPNDFPRFDSLNETCIECPLRGECKDGKVEFPSKALAKKSYHVAISQFGEWYPYFLDELLSQQSWDYVFS